MENNVGIERIRELPIYQYGRLSKIFKWKIIKVQSILCVCINYIHIYTYNSIIYF